MRPSRVIVGGALRGVSRPVAGAEREPGPARQVRKLAKSSGGPGLISASGGLCGSPSRSEERLFRRRAVGASIPAALAEVRERASLPFRTACVASGSRIATTREQPGHRGQPAVDRRGRVLVDPATRQPNHVRPGPARDLRIAAGSQ